MFFSIGCGDRFSERYWKTPIDPQGKPPAGRSRLEASLDPESCGTCHPKQYENWRESFHSKTVGPGLKWQLRRLGPEGSESCLGCHSPLSETQNYIQEFEYGSPKVSEEVRSYVSPGTEEKGIVCASCHVRGHVRHGPPPRSAIAEGIDPNAPHGGFIVKKEFESSEFCAACHDSPEGGKPLAGKRLMETGKEWKNSVYADAKNEITCQNCHMPDRSHEWKGIHDPSFTRKAVTYTVSVRSSERGYLVSASLKNTGAGHFFPTYSVPKVFLVLERLRSGRPSKVLAEKTIGRVTDIELQHEFEDTRIPPGGEVVLKTRVSEDEWRRGDEIRFYAIVEPDEFYVRMFQENWNRRKEFEIEGRYESRLSEALRRAKSTKYLLFEEKIRNL
ncbi:multiheme c-type cytochrome [Leptospira ellisii]|uniref:Multiheme c-type cytochrome n=2 Tax=Leptospira ellisii TaxID=2023197 RepID=A0A2N0BKA6_9LEPT|nr:multiheme c-type cytochrome [Leptospira ellisii]MDV6235155.1 multiheme c-type cytochrome [Leptospira ellisii]PJZ92880.1 hypothetical protein CH379_10785 [Leptospira ellisii]PKA04449.1 hypothetical protein CH375_10880 [Leptospira ellisii]